MVVPQAPLEAAAQNTKAEQEYLSPSLGPKRDSKDVSPDKDGFSNPAVLTISKALHAWLDSSILGEIENRSKDFDAQLLKLQEEKDPNNGLTMTREEYIKEQNKVFQKLTSRISFSDDSQSKSLWVSELERITEIYIASLDGKLYNQLDYYRTVLACFESFSKKHLDLLMDQPDSEKLGFVMRELLFLQKKYADLLQERQAEVDRLETQEGIHRQMTTVMENTTSQMFRLEHVARVLGEKLVEVNGHLTEANAKVSQYEAKIADLESKIPVDDKSKEFEEEFRKKAENFSKITDPKEKLDILYQETLLLQKHDSSKDIPDTPEKILSKALMLMDNARSKRNQQTKELIRAFMEQHEAREDQLNNIVERARLESQIYLAKCENLESKVIKLESELKTMIERSVSLFMADRELETELESTKALLRECERVMESHSLSTHSGELNTKPQS